MTLRPDVKSGPVSTPLTTRFRERKATGSNLTGQMIIFEILSLNQVLRFRVCKPQHTGGVVVTLLGEKLLFGTCVINMVCSPL